MSSVSFRRAFIIYICIQSILCPAGCGTLMVSCLQDFHSTGTCSSCLWLTAATGVFQSLILTISCCSYSTAEVISISNPHLEPSWTPQSVWFQGAQTVGTTWRWFMIPNKNDGTSFRAADFVPIFETDNVILQPHPVSDSFPQELSDQLINGLNLLQLPSPSTVHFDLLLAIHAKHAKIQNTRSAWITSMMDLPQFHQWGVAVLWWLWAVSDSLICFWTVIHC